MIFVFGSNLGGRHGKGAALTALRKHGAIYGRSHGRQGESYALATCGYRYEPLPLETIQIFVDEFLDFARDNEHLKFQVTRVGCGLGGYKNADIAPMFENAPDNVFFDAQWAPYLGETHECWGTY